MPAWVWKTHRWGGLGVRLEHSAAILGTVGDDWRGDVGVWVLGAVAAGTEELPARVHGKGAGAIRGQGQQGGASRDVCWRDSHRGGAADDLQDALGWVRAAQARWRSQRVQVLDVHPCKSTYTKEVERHVCSA